MYKYTYLDLPEIFYEIHNPVVFEYDEKIFNVPLGRKFNISSTKELFEKQYTPFSESYMGHQFGHPTMLGDGRQVILGEVSCDSTLQDIALKGSGKTSYSRDGDGLLPIDAALKEYIYSEFLYNIGIPTTRSLALLKMDNKALRNTLKDTALLIRVANSHLRIGTVQFAKLYNNVKAIVDYAINRHYLYLNDLKDEDKYKLFFDMVIRKNAELVAEWQAQGFVHGVMNTDNITIDGSTIDYGPCAFIETYDENAVFSEIDEAGRYRFKNQPAIMHWNLGKLGESMIQLFHEDKNKGIAIAQNSLDQFPIYFNRYWFTKMGEKIGIHELNYNNEDDKNLITDFLEEIKKRELDYTNTFRSLANNTLDFKPNYGNRIVDYKLMKQVNPAFVPRYHTVQYAIEVALNGDYNKVHEILKAITKPFNDNIPEYLKEHRGNDFITTCGT